ncbi:peptidylprolyl isomerase [Corynebacterium anserum]|uniref:Peptidyl-prolyl cis-trans isomerase n=1 Tax=Corynebacterium anserum TaxID=2684406 RepID=A0A7G7YNJ8_9CORY|nr:peptidylprolyl isomerase [Corynebacterium anserum]QNH96068.1 peptidylprolyl isomerase [Corynebacterium anserum]
MTDSNNKAMPNAQRRDEALDNLQRSIKARDRKAKAAPLGVIFTTLAVLVVIVGGIWYATTWTPDKDDDTAAAQTADQQNTAEMPSGPLEKYGEVVKCEYTKSDGKAAKPVNAPENGDVPTSGKISITLATNKGDIPLELDRGTSPCTVNSFEKLVQQKYFDNTVCHRQVKNDNMGILQCGDPTGTGTGGPGYSFADEFPTNGVKPEDAQIPVTYKRGTLAMANSGPNTNGSQFFLVTDDTALPPSYNVFGTISEDGLKVLDKIQETPPGGAQGETPAQEIKIEKATEA